MEFLNPPQSTDSLEEEDERLAARLKVEEKRALLAEVKKRYGKDWRHHLPNIKSGLDWDALRFRL